MKILFPLLALLILWSVPLMSQDVTVSTTAGHDDNIFEIYNPTPDQVTQVELDASKDWDADQLSLNLSYTGSLLLFQDLPARNYNIHWLSFTSTYQFEAPGDESDDSSTATPASGAASDSACRLLSAVMTGGSQFNKQEFSQYDNAMVSGTVLFRQPLWQIMSARPSYTLSYHSYPNLEALTNIQNVLAVHMGVSGSSSNWVAVTPAIALKHYTSSSTITYTVSTPSSGGGHGKGGGGEGGQGAMHTKTFDMTNPSVAQASLTIFVKQSVAPGTDLTAQYTSVGMPSTEARVIPQEIQGLLQERGSIQEFVLQNDIFDDKFSYHGDELRLGVRQALPLQLTLEAQGVYQHKTYTYAAMDLADSLTLAPSRVDTRSEVGGTLSRNFGIGGTRSLKAELQVRYLKNSSNAPYYDFDKALWMAGIEFSF